MNEFEIISSINEEKQQLELKIENLWNNIKKNIKHENIVLLENNFKEIKENISKKSIFEEILRKYND